MTKNPRDWRAFALLLIDVQNDFWPAEVAEAFPGFKKNTAALLALCRAEGIDVVHLRAVFSTDQSDWMSRYKLQGNIPCVSGTDGVEILSVAKEKAGEEVIIKQTFDGFHHPALDDYLRKNNKRFVLVAGLVTSVCVLFTAASAAQRGYLVAVVEDCCADGAAAHRQTLERYPFIFDKTRVAEIVGGLPQWSADLDKLTDC